MENKPPELDWQMVIATIFVIIATIYFYTIGQVN